MGYPAGRQGRQILGRSPGLAAATTVLGVYRPLHCRDVQAAVWADGGINASPSNYTLPPHADHTTQTASATLSASSLRLPDRQRTQNYLIFFCVYFRSELILQNCIRLRYIQFSYILFNPRGGKS